MLNLIQSLSLRSQLLGGLTNNPFNAYAANSIAPQLVADFKGGVYGKSSALSTFDNVLNHVRNGNATMVDADGLLKWAPHTLLTDNSEDASTWTAITDASVSSYAGSLPSGYTTASTLSKTIGTTRPYTTIKGGGGSTRRTFEVIAKYASAQFVQISQRLGNADSAVNYDIVNGTVTQVGPDVLSADITLLGNGWYLLKYEGPINTTSGIHFSMCPSGTAIRLDTYTTTDPSEVHCTGARFYHSDLGGMVNNPATGDSYVPTTSAAVYLPRVGNHVHNGTSYVNEGLLLESEARTNLLTYSQDFTDASWGKVRVTAALDAVGPDGATNSAATITAASGGGTSNSDVVHAVTTVISTKYTLSVYAKAGTLTELMLYSSHAGNTGTYFDLSAGTVGSTAFGSPLDPTIEDVGSGWYRCSLSLVATVTSGEFRAYISTGGSFVVPQDGTPSILIYGAQFEEGSTPSSYIPTAGATVTRAAETLSVPAANMPDYQTPVVIGPELVTNGDFATDSDWTLATGAAISGGQLEFSPGSTGNATQSLTLDAGKVYRITFDLVRRDGALSLRLLGGTTNNFATVSTTGPHTYYFVPNAGNNELIILATNSNIDADIDNISVKEIKPLAVSLAIDGQMTYADGGTATGDSRSTLRWYLNSSNRITHILSTLTTRTGQVTAQQISSGVADTAQSGQTTYAGGVNVPFSVSSRHGSTFINAATDGTALTADTTPTSIADLSTADLEIGDTFMGNIGKVRVWPVDIGDAGIAEASA